MHPKMQLWADLVSNGVKCDHCQPRVMNTGYVVTPNLDAMLHPFEFECPSLLRRAEVHRVLSYDRETPCPRSRRVWNLNQMESREVAVEGTPPAVDESLLSFVPTGFKTLP